MASPFFIMVKTVSVSFYGLFNVFVLRHPSSYDPLLPRGELNSK